MDKIDKTKENIRIEELDEKTRKNLFDKFVEGGGEVLSHRQRRRTMTIDRDRQRRHREKLNDYNKRTRSDKIVKGARQPSQPDSYGKTRTTEHAGETAFEFFFNRLRIRLNLKFRRIARLNGLYFNPVFFEKFTHKYKPALMEIQLLHMDLFMQHPVSGKRIINRLDKIKPLYYEIMEMASNIYDKMSIDQITEPYTSFPDVPKVISELRDPILDLFRKLYVLKPYENTLLLAFEQAIEMQKNMEEDKKKSYTIKKKRIKSAIRETFNKLYPSLHWLFCHFYGYPLPYEDPEIENILEISTSEKPGNRVQQLISDKTASATLKSEEYSDETQEKTPTMPDGVKEGLEQMYRLNLEALRDDFDPKSHFKYADINDKVLITFLLFNEFDREYSSIFTTNMIKFNIHFGSKGKEDFRIYLQELYDNMRKCHESLKNYTEIYHIYQKTRREKPAGSAQYLAYAKRLETMQKRKEQAGRMSRMVIKAYMEQAIQKLQVLIEDMEGVQKYISNPQDILEFNTEIEGQKKINGKKVYEAVRNAYNFAQALAYRLGGEGDLSGSAELKTEDITIPSSEKVAKEPTTEQKSGEPLKEQTSDKESILKELDDLL